MNKYTMITEMNSSPAAAFAAARKRIEYLGNKHHNNVKTNNELKHYSKKIDEIEKRHGTVTELNHIMTMMKMDIGESVEVTAEQIELFETELTAREATMVTAGEAAVKKAKEEYTTIRQQAGSFSQGGIKPEYEARVEKAKAAVEWAKQKLAGIKGAIGKEAESIAKMKEVEAKKKSKEELRSDAAARGQQGRKVRQGKYKTDSELHAAIKSEAMKQTENGRYVLDVAQLANTFDMDARQMNNLITSVNSLMTHVKPLRKGDK